MRRAIRLGVVAGLALAFAGVPGSGFAQDEEVTKAAPTSKEAAPKTKGTCEVSDPCEDVTPGAASMEPEPDQVIVEGPGTKAHREWVESIWNSP
jgi:hypothetical protein